MTSIYVRDSTYKVALSILEREKKDQNMDDMSLGDAVHMALNDYVRRHHVPILSKEEFEKISKTRSEKWGKNKDRTWKFDNPDFLPGSVSEHVDYADNATNDTDIYTKTVEVDKVMLNKVDGVKYNYEVKSIDDPDIREEPREDTDQGETSPKEKEENETEEAEEGS